MKTIDKTSVIYCYKLFGKKQIPNFREMMNDKERILKYLNGKSKGKIDLRWGYLADMKLIRANLPGANLSCADLNYVNLSQANLSGANLSYADLRGAILRDAILKGANLTGAKLKDSDLTGADLTDVIM